MWMLAETLRQKPYVSEARLEERRNAPHRIHVKLTKPLDKVGVQRAAQRLGTRAEVEKLIGGYDLVVPIKTEAGRNALVIRVMDAHIKNQGKMPSESEKRRLVRRLFPGVDIRKIKFHPPYPRLRIDIRYHLDSFDNKPWRYRVEKEHLDKAVQLVEAMIEESAKPLSARVRELAKKVKQRLRRSA